MRSGGIRTLHGSLCTLRALQEQTRAQVERRLASDLDAGAGWRLAVGELEARLAGHVRALDETLRRLDTGPSRVQEALGAVVGTAASWLAAARSEEPVSRMLRDLLGAVSLARIEARVLVVIAAALEDEVAARIAAEQADELEDQCAILEAVLEDVLRRELEAAGKVVPGAPGADGFEEVSS